MDKFYPIRDSVTGQLGWRCDFKKPIPLIQEIFDDIVTLKRAALVLEAAKGE